MRSISLISLAGLSLIMSAGCDVRLTPELVRGFLDAPTGTISNESMSKVTRDLFMADRATEIEDIANLVKTDFSPDGEGGGENALDGAGDVLCGVGLTTNIASFDACELGDECHGQVDIDACVLHLGDPGLDEDARGKIHFLIDNTSDAEADRSQLSIAFDRWESSRDDDLLNAIDGQLALETYRATDDSHIELVFASDVDVNFKRKVRGFLDDGITERANLSAGVRFIADSDEDSVSGSLEVLAYADLDDARSQSVVIRLQGEGHRVDAAGAIAASASLEVEGENGKFTCTWAAEATGEEGSQDGVNVKSEGECIDGDGETFSFSGEATAR